MKTVNENVHGRVWNCITPDKDVDDDCKENCLNGVPKQKDISHGSNTTDATHSFRNKKKKLFNPLLFNGLQHNVLSEKENEGNPLTDHAVKPLIFKNSQVKEPQKTKYKFKNKSKEKDIVESNQQSAKSHVKEIIEVYKRPTSTTHTNTTNDVTSPNKTHIDRKNDETDEDDIEFTISKLKKQPSVSVAKKKEYNKTSKNDKKRQEIVSISDSDNDSICTLSRNKIPSTVCDEQILSKNCFTINASKTNPKKTQNSRLVKEDDKMISRTITSTLEQSDDDDILMTTTNILPKENVIQNKRKSSETCPMCGVSFPTSRINTHAIDCSGKPVTPLSKRTRQSKLTTSDTYQFLKSKSKPKVTVKDPKEIQVIDNVAAKQKERKSLDYWNTACGQLRGVCIEKPLSTNKDFIIEPLKAKSKNKDFTTNKIATKESFDKFDNFDKDKFTPHPPTIILDNKNGLWESDDDDSNDDDDDDDDDEVKHSNKETIKQKPSLSFTVSKASSLKKKKKIVKPVSINSDTTDDELNDSIINDVIGQYLFVDNTQRETITPIQNIPSTKSALKSPEETEECYMCGKFFPIGKPYQRHVDYEIKRMEAKQDKNGDSSTREEGKRCKATLTGTSLAESLGNRKSWSSFKHGSSKHTPNNDIESYDVEIDDEDVSNSPIKSFQPISGESVFDFTSQFSNTGKKKTAINGNNYENGYNKRRPKFKRTRRR